MAHGLLCPEAPRESFASIVGARFLDSHVALEAGQLALPAIKSKSICCLNLLHPPGMLLPRFTS